MSLEPGGRIFRQLFLTILLFYLEVDGNYFRSNSRKDDQCFCKVKEASLLILFFNIRDSDLFSYLNHFYVLLFIISDTIFVILRFYLLIFLYQ